MGIFKYGVRISDKHTLKDWELACTKIEIEAPERKTVNIPVFGRDGDIDLSEVITGEPQYGNRKIKMYFVRRESNFSRWHVKSSDVLDYCHNQKHKIIFDSSPSYYYEGRLSVETSKDFRGADTFTITAEAKPYKYERYGSLEDWVWDTFCFEDGIIRDYRNLKVEGTITLMLPGRRKKVVPVFECSEALQLEYGGQFYDLPVGRSKILDIRLGEGEHYLTFTGNGTISVEYRGGRL